MRAANGDAAERTRRAPELARDDRSIVHDRESYGRFPELRALRQAGMPFTTKRRSPGFT